MCTLFEPKKYYQGFDAVSALICLTMMLDLHRIYCNLSQKAQKSAYYAPLRKDGEHKDNKDAGTEMYKYLFGL